MIWLLPFPEQLFFFVFLRHFHSVVNQGPLKLECIIFDPFQRDLQVFTFWGPPTIIPGQEKEGVFFAPRAIIWRQQGLPQASDLSRALGILKLNSKHLQMKFRYSAVR